MNVGYFLTKSARHYPKAKAVIYGDAELSYTQFNNRCNRLANALRRLGVKKGDNVSILQYNYPQMLEAIFACFKSGCAAVPINFRLHPDEFAYVIDNSDSNTVIISQEFNQSIKDIRHKIPKVRHFITISNAGSDFIDYEALIDGESDYFDDEAVAPDDLAWLFYTSGTTGRPKGAMLTHRNLVSMVMSSLADIIPLGSDDAVLHAAPLSHGSGMYAISNITKGASNVILNSKSFDPELIFKTIEENKITNMFAAPTMIQMMINSPAIENYDLSSLRAVIYGGGPMYVEVLKKAIEKLGNCLIQIFGQGESPMTITYLPHEDHVKDSLSFQENRLASAGIERTDVEVRIFDHNDREVPCGTIGEIVTRSDTVMKGYWKNPDATAEAMKSGWLHTGDMGLMDENGYLFIKDRSKDMIISGGENIYPREVEDVLLEHPAVREVAVIGVPDSKWGESVKAIVALQDTQKATENELIDFCKERLASYKKPKSIDFMEDLPKNNYGKVVKTILREKYWSYDKRKI